LAGLAGAGRTETALAIFGARQPVTGEVRIGGQRLDVGSPREAIAAGIGYLPEDRKEAGLFLELSIAANIAAANLPRFGNIWMRDRLRDQVAREYRDRLRIATPDVGRRVVNLSGGNQQKVMLARWLLLKPKVLIVDEPTRGIDIGAKAEVHGLLRELARQGTAVVVISSDLPEVLAVADKVLVMREGRLAGELSREDATEESIMRLAARGAAA
jgi:ABC-type sugar transport system ATPase subunit